MKLFYYQGSDGFQNFGDALNSWLWPKLLPNFFDEDSKVIFIGFGTLINNFLIRRISPAERVILFTTGVGYEKNLKQLPEYMQLYSVRGPRSASALHLPAEMAITDGAILVRDVWTPKPEQRDQVSFMPHVTHAKAAGQIWKQICERLQIQYIDPTEPDVETVLNQINRSKLMLAEAMHGAIVADALRVPWIPLRTSAEILTFKWLDWCDSVQCRYQPRYLPPLLSAYPRFAQGLRSGLKSLGYWNQAISQSPKLHLDLLIQERFGIRDSIRLWEQALAQVATSGLGYLSDFSHWQHLHDRLLRRLDDLKNDWI
jgi:succinoglycan biosynthesis protein ExoV